jgi:nucleoid DNA-binding protein
MLTQGDIAREIEHRTGIKPNLSKNVLNTLIEIAAEEIAAGEGFAVPGLVKFDFRYSPAYRKGERYVKGDTVSGPQGERVAEEDSPARKERMKLVATPMAKAKAGLQKGAGVLPLKKGTRGYKRVVERKKK